MADVIAHSGVEPRTSIGAVTPDCLSWIPSSTEATPSISTPDASKVGAVMVDPCPYASALTTAKNFVSEDVKFFNVLILCSMCARFISTHASRLV